jgi:hypothetical protein
MGWQEATNRSATNVLANKIVVVDRAWSFSTTAHQYVEADLAMKEKALSRLKDPNVLPRRFRADDSLMDFLRTL